MLMKVYLWFRKNILKIDDRSQLEIAIENGLKIGKNHNIQDQVILDWSHCWLIEIGDRILGKHCHTIGIDELRDTVVDLGIDMVRSSSQNDTVAVVVFQPF